MAKGPGSCIFWVTACFLTASPPSTHPPPVQLPSGTDEAEKLAVLIRQDFDAGKELSVSVMKVRMGCLHSVWGGCVGNAGVAGSAVFGGGG